MIAGIAMATAVTMTGLEFDALPPEQCRDLELLDGEVIQMASPTFEHQKIAFRIEKALDEHLSHKAALVARDVEFALTANARLRPDVWVVLPPRAGEIDLSRVPIPSSPDLAVEVISPGEYASQSLRKADFYLDHGTREVWQVYPDTREVVIYGPQGQGRRCREGAALVSWLLADLAVPVSQFFASE